MMTLLTRLFGMSSRAFSMPVAIALVFLHTAGPVRGQLKITPTFDSSIAGDPNASIIEASINATIARIEAAIINPITVNITFQETRSGLGGSSTFTGNIPYGPANTPGTYLNALTTKQILSANDTTAIASLGNLMSSTNPVNSNANVTLTTPLLRALGFDAPETTDCTIGLNTSIMNLARPPATQNGSFYDLQAVAGHEIDEAMGIGGTGSALPTTNGAIGTLDLFRYNGPSSRSFTTANTMSTPAPYFSINGGVTDLVHFNQADAGSDYSDWSDGVMPGDGHGNSPPQMQDAFATPGVDVNIGNSELTALDVIGYNLSSAVPEPGAMILTVAGLAAAAFFRRRRKAVAATAA
jgi:PEP-CTERM motif